MLKKLLNLDKDSYYQVHLSLVNCVLPTKLTPKELEVLAGFMALDGEIALHRFGPTAKKLIMEKVAITPAGLSNYLGALQKKGFLIKQGDTMQIWPVIVPQVNQEDYVFRLVNKDHAKTEVGEIAQG